jgi:hypothetical protein
MTYRLHDMPPLPLDDDFVDAVTDIAERVNDFVYDGDRLQGVLGAIRAMCADPELARRLLGD